MNTSEFRAFLAGLDPASRWVGFDERSLGRLTADSRKIAPGDCFVAQRGEKVDSHAFLSDVIARGAGALLVEQPLPSGPGVPPQAVVSSTRKLLGPVASAWFGHPSRALTVAGVTGTNGKTTTAFLLRTILECAGHRAGLLGTIAYWVGDRQMPSSNTTPGPIELQEHFAAMRREGMTHAVMEVSSHSLVQDRVAGTRYAAAIFTNLGRDHMDYHQNADNYREAKAILFRGLDPGAVAVGNADDAAWGRIAPGLAARVVTFGIDRPADLRAHGIRATSRGVAVRFEGLGESVEIESGLVGRHNVQNMLAAAACARSLGVGWEAITAGIRQVPFVRGRLEPVDAGQPFRVLVDYAHTHNALANVLDALRPVTEGRLIVLFGCGGDRDRGKRPLMGQAAEDRADFTILTSDNPRSEDPEAILREIQTGMTRRDRYRVVVDRAEAIREALAMARPGDVVLLAGKGHETEQIFRDGVRPFDDAAVARAILTKDYAVKAAG